MIARRAVIIAPLALAACSAMPASSTLAMVAEDVKNIGFGLSKAFDRLLALNVQGFTADLITTCQTALGNIMAAADVIASLASVSDAQPVVQRIEGYVNTFVGTLSAFPLLPAEIKTALVAASVLLPVVEAAVNLVVAPRAQPTMTADQARIALKQ